MRLLRWLSRPRRRPEPRVGERERRAQWAIEQALRQTRHQQDQEFARDIERRRRFGRGETGGSRL